jgi:small-conductance mechanosensitive channel
MHQLAGWFDYLGVPAVAVFGTVAIPVLAGVTIIAVNRTLRRLTLGPRPTIQLPAAAVEIAQRVLGILLWICAGLLILDTWGVGVSGLWTVLVSILTAVGVGFLAVWTMVSNVTASLFITIWRPFHLGETVEILPEGLRGHVTARNLMFTVVRESNGTILQVPNNFFFQKIFRIGTTAEILTEAHPPYASESGIADAAAGRSSHDDRVPDHAVRHDPGFAAQSIAANASVPRQSAGVMR